MSQDDSSISNSNPLWNWGNERWIRLVAPFCVQLHNVIFFIYVACIFLHKYKYMGMSINNDYFCAFEETPCNTEAMPHSCCGHPQHWGPPAGAAPIASVSAAPTPAPGAAGGPWRPRLGPCRSELHWQVPHMSTLCCSWWKRKSHAEQ